VRAGHKTQILRLEAIATRPSEAHDDMDRRDAALHAPIELRAQLSMGLDFAAKRNKATTSRWSILRLR
jgi:hypothetical protein